MDPTTFDNLQEIRRRHPIEFGKICQILLAIACVRVGFRRVVERCVQGVDIDAGEHATFPNLSIEVKTTLSGKIHIGQKDIEGLAGRAKAIRDRTAEDYRRTDQGS